MSHQVDWLAAGTARILARCSNETADETLSRLSPNILLSVRGLQGNQDAKCFLMREHPGAFVRRRKIRMKWASKRAT